MAFTPLLFEGWETGGLERASSVTGSPTVGTNVRAEANGLYSLTAVGGSVNYVKLDPYEYQGSASNNAKGLGFYVDASTYTAATYLCEVRDSATAAKFNIRILSDGDLYIDNNTGGLVYRSEGTGFMDDPHFIEVWYEDGNNSAAIEVWVDGVNVASKTAQTLTANQTAEIRLGQTGGTNSNDSYIDDFYFGEATATTDLLGGMDIFATVGDGSATTGGDTLDAGSWANVQEIPKVDANLASYNAGAGGNTDEREAPTSLITQTNLTGAYTDIDDDPDSPDGNWLTAAGSSTLLAAMANPTGSPTVGAGLQNFRVLLRKNATGPVGGGQNLAPDNSVFTLTNLSGSYTDVGEDPDSPDGNWLVAPGNNNNTDVRASFATPTVAPTGNQTFRAWVRKTNHSTDPTAVVELYETGGGTLLATVVASTTITSTTGQMLSGTFAASLLATADGSAVEMKVVGTVGSGNPTNRASVEVGTMQWQEAYTGAETQPGYEVRLYENGSVVAAVAAATGVLTDAGGDTIVQLAWDATNLGTADGSLVECYVNQTSGADRYIEVGAVEWNCKYPTPIPAESGWIEADSGTKLGPSGVSGLNEIVGLTTYVRTQYSGSGSTLTHSLYRGNDVDGVTLLTLGNATAALADFFDITNSAAIMPLITEQTRVGFGHPVSVDVDIDATEIIGMVAHVPLVETGKGIIYNPIKTFQHLLMR